MVFHFRKIVLGIFIVLFSLQLNAQMFYFRDSLEVLQLEKKLVNTSGLEKIDIQNKIAASAVLFNLEKAFTISKSTLFESDKFGYYKGRAFANSNIGFYYFLKNDFIQAYLFQIQALNIIEETDYEDVKMMIHERIGYIYYFSKAGAQQIVNHFDVIRNYYDSIGDKNRAATMLVVQGGGSYRSGKYSESFNYFNQFIEYTKNIEVPRIEKLIVNYSLGDIFFIRNDMENTWRFYKRCLELKDVKFIEEIALMANIYLKIGDYYNHIKKSDSAIYYYNQCLSLSESIYYSRGQMKANNSLGRLFKSTKEFERSVSYYNAGYQFGSMIDSKGSFFFHPKFNHLIDVTDESWMSSPKDFKKYYGKIGIVEALTNLVYLEFGNTKKQDVENKLDHLLSLKDSIINYQVRKEIIDLGLKYETKKKEQQILLLQKESELQNSQASRSINILIILVLVSIITGLLLLLYNRNIGLKADKEKSKLQQKLFRSQMNPHFIFNSLASIQNLIINEDSIKASKYLARFSKLVRNILDSSVEEFISLEEEIMTIDNYLALQKIRFPNKFDYDIKIDKNIHLESTLIPPMLAQPFIENSIEHGFKHKNEKGSLKIRFKLNGNLIRFEVEDDGLGREKAIQLQQTQNSGHRSMSTEITRERLQVLNKNVRQKIVLNIEDLKDENGNPTGTKVTFDIPYKN